MSAPHDNSNQDPRRVRAAELLLACIAPHMDDTRASRAAELAGAGVNWATLLERSVTEKVRPHLLRGLRRLPPGSVPRLVLEQLADSCASIGRRNSELARSLGEVAALFASAGVKAVAYKGPVLALAAFGDLEAREYSDLDLLVAREDFERARQVLVDAGFRLAGNEPHVTEYREAEMVRAADGLNVDLHYGVLPIWFFADLDMRPLLDTAVRTEVAGAPVWAMSPEGALLMLCLEGAREKWRLLQHVCDVAALADRPGGIDWATLRTMTPPPLERVPQAGIAVAHALLGAQSTEVPTALQPICEQVRRRTLHPAQRRSGLLEENHRFYFWLAARPQDKARLVLRWLPYYARQWTAAIARRL
jgi:hypothetical protein